MKQVFAALGAAQALEFGSDVTAVAVEFVAALATEVRAFGKHASTLCGVTAVQGEATKSEGIGGGEGIGEFGELIGEDGVVLGRRGGEDIQLEFLGKGALKQLFHPGLEGFCGGGGGAIGELSQCISPGWEVILLELGQHCIQRNLGFRGEQPGGLLADCRMSVGGEVSYGLIPSGIREGGGSLECLDEESGRRGGRGEDGPDGLESGVGWSWIARWNWTMHSDNAIPRWGIGPAGKG